MITRPSKPGLANGRYRNGPRRTLDESALREELRTLLAARFRSARIAERIHVVRRQLRTIEFRSPHK